ncbi:MAG: hypothetical protein IIZ92_11960, partial [Aquincola sp.]|nr:hypothetical protein [Aquincola sp.]
GFNIRWLLRAIVRLGLAGLLSALMLLALIGRLAITALTTSGGPLQSSMARRRLVHRAAGG